jgi:hypothetical protein
MERTVSAAPVAQLKKSFPVFKWSLWLIRHAKVLRIMMAHFHGAAAVFAE